jgi:hypothetical protein
MVKTCLIGSTVYFYWQFFDRADGVTPVEVTDPVVKLYDLTQTQIGDDIEPIRADVGAYEAYITIPNNSPYIDIEITVVNNTFNDVSRDRVFTIWAEEDISLLPTITLTEGDNTYVSLEDAEEYMVNKLNSQVWDAASPNDKAKALIQATKSIDKLQFMGIKFDCAQKLQFPRVYINSEPPELVTLSGEIPQAVKDATCEEALCLIANMNNSSVTARMDLQAQGIKRIKFGDSEEEYFKVSRNKLSTTESMDLIRQYTKLFPQ